jgi:hypothetical protein
MLWKTLLHCSKYAMFCWINNGLAQGSRSENFQFFIFSGTINSETSALPMPQSHPLTGSAVSRKVNQPALTS